MSGSQRLGDGASVALFEWSPKKEIAALSLAAGDTEAEAGDKAGVSRRTIQRWKTAPDFATEVDRLSLMTEIASRAHRLRIANRAIRQMVKGDGTIPTNKDILDWLKYAQGETDGVKLDMVNLLDAYRDKDNE